MILNKLSQHFENFITNVSYEIAAYSYNELGNILESLNDSKVKQRFNNADEMEKLKRSIRAAREAAEKVAKNKEETVEE